MLLWTPIVVVTQHAGLQHFLPTIQCLEYFTYLCKRLSVSTMQTCLGLNFKASLRPFIWGEEKLKEANPQIRAQQGN